ncbi:helix-turn-helix domain-containing protein [Mycolicibacterium sphagni]|uniref:helix-turn-helix domain-containing protein n=1 Tax=Mycolicibacterium sphagni TaxID=1786 RepID=UPI00397606D9
MSWARHAVAETILRRTRTGEPVPQPLHDVLSRLTDLLVIGVPVAGSVDGTGFDAGLGELAEWLDSAEAAAVIGCTREYVRRIAEGLGGSRIGRRWIFPPDAIQEHVQGKEGA